MQHVSVRMSMIFKCFFPVMSLKSRRFSLDSAVAQDGKRSSGRFSGKKTRHSHSLDDGQLNIQELKRCLDSAQLSKQTITEENHEHSDGLINKHSFVKHNKTFHKLFHEIPEEEILTHSFTCALQKEVLYHGKLFISESHVCFHSSVLLKETKVVIPVSSIQEVHKHNSALSMLHIQTSDGEKHSFVSLRNREMCYELLQTVCSHAKRGSPNSSPQISSAENEVDHDLASGYSSLEDSSNSHELSRQNSIHVDHDFPYMARESPNGYSSSHQNSSVEEDDRAVSDWIWRIVERVSMLFCFRQTRNLSLFFYLNMVLMVVLLLASGYISLRIIALEQQLKSLGALAEPSMHYREYQET